MPDNDKDVLSRDDYFTQMSRLSLPLEENAVAAWKALDAHDAELRRQLASALEAQQRAERERDKYLGAMENVLVTARRRGRERDEARAEVQRLKSVCFEAYQFAGCLGAPERVLDNLSDAVHGNKQRHETILPVSPDECAEVQRLREWMKAANQFAWAHERTCPRHDADEPCNCGLDQFLSGPRPFVESYKTEVQRLTQAAKYEADVAMQAVAEVQRLSVENAELRKDRERLNALEALVWSTPGNGIALFPCRTVGGKMLISLQDMGDEDGSDLGEELTEEETLRAAIDAAMGAPGEGQE